MLSTGNQLDQKRRFSTLANGNIQKNNQLVICLYLIDNKYAASDLMKEDCIVLCQFQYVINILSTGYQQTLINMTFYRMAESI
jgi:hypothetical protein